MGIKGIYPELGPSRRVSLSKLAAESFEKSNRPFRIAIDAAIWQFQAQAARGGTNPAVRTLFYRLARLLGTPVQAVFVFDGSKKPAFKRNKRSGRGNFVSTAQAKCLIQLFGFVAHDAPGEAEAECALLQRQGIVDAVLSEDVDTIMFGCTRTLRNWSSERMSYKTPTHVSLYDVGDMNLAGLGLDREGMVLVALMSGGDYIPEGIPGCGVKVACEAAKAGFGKAVCRLKSADTVGMRKWRESLIHELRTNEKGFFRTKHKALLVPDDFPNFEVLRYYTHPVVSQQSRLDSLRDSLDQRPKLWLDSLREFCRETLGWDFRLGAIKFIRVLGQAVLTHKMLYEQADGEGLVKQISGRRLHFSTDGTPELRLSYVPSEVVPIDLSKEVDEQLASGRDGLALNSDNEFEAGPDDVEGPKASVFDVTKPDLAWVLEGVARKSVPDAILAWEEGVAAKAARKAPSRTKAGGARAKKPAAVARGALDGFVRVTKVASRVQDAGKSWDDGGLGGVRSVQRQPIPSTSSSLPSLQASKRPSPQAAKSPAEAAADRPTGSSQVLPRLPGVEPASQPEAILLSSSPVASPFPCPAPPRLRSRPRDGTHVAGAEARGDGIRPAFPTSASPQEVNQERRKATRRQASSRESAARGGTQAARSLKQTSMDRFLSASGGGRKANSSRAEPCSPDAATKRRTGKGKGPTVVQDSSDNDGDDASDLEPLSVLMSQTQASPSKRRQKGAGQEKDGERACGSPKKKKLMVPRVSAAGFFDELEVEAEQREARLALESERLERRGVRGGAARWSDVSIIDLTTED